MSITYIVQGKGVIIKLSSWILLCDNRKKGKHKWQYENRAINKTNCRHGMVPEVKKQLVKAGTTKIHKEPYEMKTKVEIKEA